MTPRRRAIEPSRDHRDVEALLLARFAPAWILVDEDNRIVQVRGRTLPFLRAPEGIVKADLFGVAGPTLGPALRSLLRQARRRRRAVAHPPISMKVGRRVHGVTMEAIPVPAGLHGTRRFIVRFETTRPGYTLQAPRSGREREASTTIQGLRDDKASSQKAMKKLSDKHDATTEELRSTNEEMQEDKGALRRSDRELIAVNKALEQRNVELAQANSDLDNLLASIDVPIVLVGTDLRVRKFTPPASAMFQLKPTDMGRPLSDLRWSLEVEDFEGLVKNVVRSLASVDLDVQDHQGRWFVLRIRPYRTADNRVDGAAVVLVDVDRIKQAERKEAAAAALLRSIVDAVPHPMMVLDRDLRVRTTNASFLRLFHLSVEKTEGQPLKAINAGPWDLASVVEGFRTTTVKDPVSREISGELPGLGRRQVVVSAARVAGQDDLLFMMFDDVTIFRNAERDLRHANTLLSNRAQKQSQLVNLIAHEVRTPLAPIRAQLAALRAASPSRVPNMGDLDLIGRNVERVNRVVTDMLDQLAIEKASANPEPTPLLLNDIVDDVIAMFSETATRFGISVERMPGVPLVAMALPDRVSQILVNLVSNAIKFTFKGGRVEIRLRRQGKQVRVDVRDTGLGFSRGDTRRLFEPFAHVHPGRSGSGLGLYLSRAMAQDLGGKLEAHSAGPGRGSTFTLFLRSAKKQARGASRERRDAGVHAGAAWRDGPGRASHRRPRARVASRPKRSGAARTSRP